MAIQMNQSLSVDCAVFGFNGKTLKVLLVERRYYTPNTLLDKFKLPGLPLSSKRACGALV